MSTQQNGGPQLGIRIATLGVVAFGVFAVLFLRLWFLQVLQGDEYLSQADSIRDRIVKIAAPRGEIVDREGRVLVANKVSTIITLRPDALPKVDKNTILNWGQTRSIYDSKVKSFRKDIRKAEEAIEKLSDNKSQKAKQQRADLEDTVSKAKSQIAAVPRTDNPQTRPASISYSKNASPEIRKILDPVSKLTGVEAEVFYDRIKSAVVLSPIAEVPLKRGVSNAVRDFVLEHPKKFPGVYITREFVRKYPYKSLSSQMLGQVGEISKRQLSQLRKNGRKDLRVGSKIGQSGIEAQYDSYLFGREGEQTIEVDSTNNPTGNVKYKKSRPGDRLTLTVDADLSRVAANGLRKSIGKRIDKKSGKKKNRAGGAAFAMNPVTGESLAMVSYPSIDLSVFNKNLTKRQYESVASKRAGSPLLNRAISEFYPTGSTFKPITAMAGLDARVITPDLIKKGGACRTYGNPPVEKKCNAGGSYIGDSNLARALEVSSDVYFYDIGEDVFNKPNRPLQTWAGNFGYGKKTGIDLPGEVEGIIPSAEWRKQRNQEELKCRAEKKRKSCGIVFSPTDDYKLGDNINLGIGQGDSLVSPIQVAAAYSGLYPNPTTGAIDANLRFPQPYLALKRQDSKLTLKGTFKDLHKVRNVRIDEAGWKQSILQGLSAAVIGRDGTATGVFSGWPADKHVIWGKTGTAQRCSLSRKVKNDENKCPDQSWFVGMIADKNNPIVAVATVEDGGNGASSAAPIVCKMLRSYAKISPNQVACGSTNGR